MTSRADALELARRVVAANCACAISDFHSNDNTVVEISLQTGRIPFHLGHPHIGLATFGAGVVAAASAEWVPWTRRLISKLDRDEIFSPACLARATRHVQRSGQLFVGPQHRYVCAENLWQPVAPPVGIAVETIPTGAAMEHLRQQEFSHALSSPANAQRPDMLAAVARSGNQTVGLAAASHDHPDLWQIGVDVVASHRGAGLGAALVSACARGVLDADRVPYYSTHLSNLRSQSTALRCGFVPAWTEAYVYVPRSLRVAGDFLGQRRPAGVTPVMPLSP